MEHGAVGVPVRRNNRLALASLICGIAGFVPLICFTLPPAISAVVMGFIALSQIRRSGGTQHGSWMAITGIITGAVSAAINLAIVGLAIYGLSLGP